MANSKAVAVAAVMLVVGLGVGILLGHFVTAPAAAGKKSSTGESTPSSVPKSYQDAVKEPDPSIGQRVINGITPERIRENLK